MHHLRLSIADERLVEGIVAGMTVKAAAAAANLGIERTRSRLNDPAVLQAIAEKRAEMRKKFQLTREQCVEGMLRAIQDAKLLADPSAQIAGWREIARMLGHYEPEKRVIELSDKREEAVQQLQSLDMGQLVEMAGDNVIDGEFKLIEDDSRGSARH